MNDKLGHLGQKLPILGQETERSQCWRLASDDGVNVSRRWNWRDKLPLKSFLGADVTTLGWEHYARPLRTFPPWMWDKRCIITVLRLCHSGLRHTLAMCTSTSPYHQHHHHRSVFVCGGEAVWNCRLDFTAWQPLHVQTAAAGSDGRAQAKRHHRSHKLSSFNF